MDGIRGGDGEVGAEGGVLDQLFGGWCVAAGRDRRSVPAACCGCDGVWGDDKSMVSKEAEA